MRFPVPYVAAVTIALWCVFYLVAAFVTADLYWMRDVMSWGRADRAFLLYWMFIGILLGVIYGLWLRRKK